MKINRLLNENGTGRMENGEIKCRIKMNRKIKVED
jgi:hypothetical protein